MDIQKITKYVVLALGVIGLVLQVIILRKGDDAIEMAGLSGDFSSVSPMISLALAYTNRNGSYYTSLILC
jgi:hypothetical protein